MKIPKDFSFLVGSTIEETDIDTGIDSASIIFSKDGSRYRLRMYHEQDCRENVAIHDLDGDPKSLIGVTVSIAEESSDSVEYHDRGDESGTWTFYRMLTSKGGLVIRWLGTSNGYYSESVSTEIELLSGPGLAI